MEGYGSHWEHALATDAVGETLGKFISHLESANLAFTLLRSALFSNPGRIDEVFDKIHCFGHRKSKPTNSSTIISKDSSVLAYWREKAVVCEDCTSFLSEILASSWRHCGPELSRRYNQRRDQLPRFSHVNYDSIGIMTNLFEYMNMAYERLEKETKIALQTETHSSAFKDSCNEFFSDNFDTINDTARLEALLSSLHETNINLLLARLYGGHHVEDTIQRDREAFSRLTITKEDHTYSFFEGADNQTEEQAPLNLPKGKNHDQNRKKLERKKKKRLAARAEKSEVEASEDPRDALKKRVATPNNSVEKHGDTTLENNGIAHVSQGPTICEDVHPAHLVGLNKRADEPSIRDLTVNSPKAIKEPVKRHIVLGNPSAANNLQPTSPVISDPVEDPISDVVLEDLRGSEAAYQYREHLEAILEVGDNREWIQVVGSRKKPKEKNSSGSNSTLASTSTVRENRHIFRGASRSQGSETFTKSLETAKNPAHQTKPRLRLQNQQTLASAASKSTIPNLSESNKSVSASAVPKPYTHKKRASTSAAIIPTVGEKTNTVSTTTGQRQGPQPLQRPSQVPTVLKQKVACLGFGHDSKASNIEGQPLPTTSSDVIKNQFSRSKHFSDRSQDGIPSSVTEAAADSSKPVASNVYPKTTTSAKPADLRDITQIATVGHIVDSQRNHRGLTRLSLEEVIDPGPVPHYQHLTPFKKVKKMSGTTQATLGASIAPNPVTISLVESLRDAGVEDGAMTSLVPGLVELLTVLPHPRLPDVGGSRLRPFAGKNLDVKRANKSAKSAGNSPIPPHITREFVFHYPPPDILTPENQEILDLIIKGPPYKKLPRAPSVVDQEKNQPLASDFVTTKPKITTYDGKDAYEVLGDHCPAPLTLGDHPSANKCTQSGKMFRCAYCCVEISGDADAEKGIICPGCGPCSETRYCQRSHLLADSMSHSKVCGEKTGAYPLMWSELPLHYQSLYPYIKPLTGSMTAQCFRQMAHCLIINSDGIIENPLKAYFEVQMVMENKVRVYNYVQQMYQFQDRGQYYLFYPGYLAGGVEISLCIAMNDGSDGCFREDQRFARVRNAAFLTHHPTLLCAIYRRVKAAIQSFAKTEDEYHQIMQTFYSQFHEEFPTLKVNDIAPLDKDYCFENDWRHTRNLVHDLERGNPILRAWITEDVEDGGIPTDPVARFEGRYWNFVNGPTFRAGSADRRDWGAGWFGQDGKIWQKQLDRKYLKMITDKLAQLETELEGDII